MNEKQKLYEHYILEKNLAQKIKDSRPEERKKVTSEAYKTLYEKIYWHISRVKSDQETAFELNYNATYLIPLVDKRSKVLELACGTGRTTNFIGRFVSKAIGIDTTLINRENNLNDNVQLLENDVSNLSLGTEKFNLIFSLHLIEHLHPDDLLGHIKSIYDHLEAEGRLFMITPHLITGPHDISKYFDDYATGFHLKEYTYRELSMKLKQTGFHNIRTQCLPRFIIKRFPFLYRSGLVSILIPIIIETFVALLPTRKVQRFVGKIVRLSNIIIYASKK